MSDEPKTVEELLAQREAWLAGAPAMPTEEASDPEVAVADAVEVAPAEAEPAAVEAVAPPPVAQAEVVEEKPVAAEAKPAVAKQEAAPPPPAEKPAAQKPAPAKKAAPAKKRAAKKKAAPFVRPANVTRREFLNLAWLGSIALLTVQSLGVSVLFLFPRFKEGDFGGVIPIGNAASQLPEVGAPPIPFASGKFWLTNTNEGAYAIYQVCTHLGCLYAWSDITSQFECPCHGSKYKPDGTFIEGPAPRSLDRFPIIATKPDGSEVRTSESGAGLKLDGDEELAVDTGSRILLDGKVDASTLT